MTTPDAFNMSGICTQNIPKLRLHSKAHSAIIFRQTTEECMKEPTETDFTHSVDREIIRQVGDLNFRGLSLIRQNLISSDPASSIVACTDRSLWSALNDASLKQVAEAPYLLFELPFDPILSVDDERADDRSGDHQHVWSTASGRDYVRLLCHFAWQVSRGRAVAATLLLGLAPQAVERLRAVPLPDLDPLADRNRGELRLRWNTDPWFWGRRLEAANAADQRRLWQTTYAGVQRLASLSRPSASV
jgi:hypothetical protein